jgi:hypothetical protein
MSMIGPLLAIGGGVMGALGSVEQANAAKFQGASLAAAANYNAAVDEQRAAAERDAAKAEAQDFARMGSRKVAEAEVGQAASGVVANTGSPLMVDASTVREIALGAQRKLYSGEVRATDLTNDAQLQRANAQNALKGANITANAYYLGAGTNLLTGAARAWGF